MNEYLLISKLSWQRYVWVYRNKKQPKPHLMTGPYLPIEILAINIVVKLKGRTRRLLSPVSQPGFVVQRQREAWCCICRQNRQHLREFSNRPQLDKKTGEQEKWNVTTKLCKLNSFLNNTERKKQEVMSKMADLKVRKWCECILCVEHWKYRKQKCEHRWEYNL